MRDIIIGIVVLIVLYMLYKNNLAAQAIAATATTDAAAAANTLHAPINTIVSTTARLPVINESPAGPGVVPIRYVAVTAQAPAPLVANNFTSTASLLTSTVQ